MRENSRACRQVSLKCSVVVVHQPRSRFELVVTGWHTVRRGHDVDALLAEWEATAPALREALLAMDAMPAAQVVFDLTTHEHDLRGALQVPGERDTAGV
ncbi:MAG: hypothetical protein KY442_10285, partial [Proteobacteria bacterium]|nr:hypothetical protein [Pseudomonadota bacterium]